MAEKIKTIWLSPEQVANDLNMSISTVYRYLNSPSNALPSYKLSRSSIRIKKAELDKWIETNLKIINQGGA